MMTYFISGQNVGKDDDDGKMPMESDLDGVSIFTTYFFAMGTNYLVPM